MTPAIAESRHPSCPKPCSLLNRPHLCLILVVLAALGACEDTAAGRGAGVIDASGDVGVSGGDAAAPIRPAAFGGTLEVDVGETASGRLEAVGGTPLTFTIIDGPTYGELVAFDALTGAFTYSTQRLVAGTDHFTFSVSDGTQVSATPGTLTVAITPFHSTGQWTLGALSNDRHPCTGGSFPIKQLPDSIIVGGRVITCDGVDAVFDEVTLAVDGTDLKIGDNVVGARTDSSLTFAQAAVTPCGAISMSFALTKQVNGFDYAETLVLPCRTSYDVSGRPSYIPTALTVFEPTPRSLGSAVVGKSVSRVLEAVNYGKVAATLLSVPAPSGPFGWLGGAYPGNTGSCGAELAPRRRCTLQLEGSPPTTGMYHTSLYATYNDGIAEDVATLDLMMVGNPQLSAPSRIAAGGDFQCAIDGGAVVCWGEDSFGRLAVPALVAPTEVDASFAFACAIDASGAVCWGDGAGSFTIPPLSHPTQISAGSTHACALHDGGVVCWGSNAFGQTAVPPLTHPKRVAAGGYHTCAIDDDGVKC